MSPTRVRLSDVAAACHVSASTVSYVLSGKAQQRGLSAQTVQRVVEAADALGYVRNRSASALRRGRTNTLVLFYRPPMNRFIERYVMKATAVLRPLGYQILATPVLDHEAGVVVETLASGVCDACVVDISRPALEELYELAPRPAVPALVLNASPGAPEGYDRLCYEEDRAVAQALQHLVDHGARSIAMAAQESERDEVGRSVLWQAYEGFQRARAAEPDLLIHAGSDVPSIFRAAISELARRQAAHTLPDAIYCSSDRVAIGVLMAAEQLGIAVPTELCVIGTGNSAEAQTFATPLTTIGLSDDSITSALSALIHRVEDDTSTASATAEPWRLFLRRTTRS